MMGKTLSAAAEEVLAALEDIKTEPRENDCVAIPRAQWDLLMETSERFYRLKSDPPKAG